MPPRSPCIGLAAIMVTGAAYAAPQEPVSIRLEGSIPCTSEADFFARVHRRTPAARSGQPGEPTRSFTIKLEGVPPLMMGRLSIVHLDGRSSTREVNGESCGEVIDALALITAVDIDPDAVRPVTVDRPAPEPAPPAPEAIPVGATAPPLPSEPWRWAAGVEASRTTGVAPHALYGVPIYVEVASPSTKVLSPAFQLGFERTFNSTTELSYGDAVFHTIQGFAQSCPIAWSAPRFRLSPCARFDAGVLEGSGLETKNVGTPLTQKRAWLALGLAGRASVALAGPVSLHAHVGLGIPLVHYRFELAGIPSGEVQTWSFRAGIGLAVRFL